MGDWDVVSTAPARPSGSGTPAAGEWDVVSTAPSRGRRGGAAPQRTGVGSSPENPVPRGQAVPVGQYGEGPDGSIQFRTANGWRLVRRANGQGANTLPPRPPGPRTAAAPQGTALAYGQYGLQGTQDSVTSQTGAVGGMVNPANVFGDALSFAADATDNIGNLFNAATGRGNAAPAPSLPSVGPVRSSQNAAVAARRTGIDLPEARTAGERLAYFAGSAAPGLLLPGGATTTGALALGGGTLGGWGAGEWARSAGLSPEGIQIAELGGGLVGGGLGAAASGIRRTPGAAPPTGLDPANPLRPLDAVRSAEYVRRQMPNNPSPQVPARGATTAETAGPRASTALAALARREGTTSELLQGRLDARRADRTNRMQQDVQRGTGVAPGDAAANIEALVQAGRDRVRPLFRAVENDPTPVASPRLTVLSETPVIQRALRAAYEDLANNPDGPQAAGVFREGPNGLTVAEPTMATWDKVYKSLQGQVERNQFTGRPLPDTQSPTNAGINRARAALRSELGRLSPQWDNAIRSSGEYVPVEAAYRDGNAQILAQNVSEADVRARVARLNEGELQGYRAGIANRIFDMAQNGRLTPRMLSTPRVRAKLEIALGRPAAQELIDAVQSEAAMAAFEQRYGNNSGSITSEINTAQREQDAVGGNRAIDGALNLAEEAVRRRSFRGAILNWLGQQAVGLAARARTRGMSVEARNEAGRILAGDMSPAEATAYAERVRTQAEASRPRLTYAPPQAGNMLAPLATLPSASPRRTER